MSNSQINLPKTAFSMKANLPTREPEILKFWEEINLYRELRNSRKGEEKFVQDTRIENREEIDGEQKKERQGFGTSI